MISIPKNGQYVTQPNNSDVNGDLWASFNIDTSENEGRIRLGKRLILNTGTNDVAQITSYPAAFQICGSAVYAIAGLSNVGYAFKNDLTMVGTFTRDVSAGAPATLTSNRSDVTFASNGGMYISGETPTLGFISLYKKVGNGAWSEVATTETADANYTNMLCSYINRVYMSSVDNKVISLSTADSISYSGAYTVTLPNAGFQSIITKLLPADDRIFILTVSQQGSEGYVYEWDGRSTEVSYIHKLESAGALAGVMFEGTPYIVDTTGALLVWNGGTFTKVAELNRENNLPLYNPVSATNNRFIHPNGMTIVNGKIQILIDNRNYDSGSTIEETIPSGIYEYDPKIPSKGLVHKHSFSSNKSTDIVTNYGQVRINGAGAIRNMYLNSTAAGANGTFFAGAGYYTNATTVKYGIFYDDRNDTLEKTGYLITTKNDSVGGKSEGAIKNMWQKVIPLYRKLLTANDKIVLKYRTSEAAPLEITGTWTSSTTFTTTTDVTAYWTSGTGGEVEVLNGIGAGRCSHITSISYSNPTYTVTVDETYYGATGTFKARLQAWKKLKTISSRLDTYEEAVVGEKSNWIQFKIWMLWTGRNELEKLLIINSNDTPAV